MTLRSAAICLVLTATAVQGQPRAQQLDSLMRVAERNGFSGAVLVEKDGVVLLEKGYGMADRTKRVPFTPATIVQIGSNTKDFTAVAILQLQHAGRLSMNDSVGKYFANVPADKKGITIRQLMNHRAGFPLGVGGDFEAIGRSALVQRALETPLLFAPGSRESYSNTGFSLLAAIIEQVSGKAYDVYVRDEITSPLGLSRTGFLLPGFASGDLAHGYRTSGEDAGTMLAKPHAPDGPHWNLRGNGGMLSTVGEMRAFYKALFESEKLLPAAVRNPRFNPEEPTGLAGSDGVNFFLYDRFPGMQTTIIIASTNAAMKAPAVRRELGKVLGLPDPDGGPAEQVVRRPGGVPAPAAVAAVVTQFVRTLNSGDNAVMRAFIADHFTFGPGVPDVEARLALLNRMHANLGTLTVDSAESFESGPVEVRLTSSTEGKVLLRLAIDREAPHRIGTIQVLVGG